MTSLPLKFQAAFLKMQKSLYSDKIILIGHAAINRIYTVHRLRIKDSRKQRLI